MAQSSRSMCRHFTGIMNKTCQQDISYESVKDRSVKPVDLACFGECGVSCEKYSPYTAEELEAQEEEIGRYLGALAENKSPCCKAEIDVSQVVTTGKRKGHGPRFCSKCKKWLFTV